MLHSAKVISPCVISRRAARDSLRGCADLRAPGAFAGRMTGRSPRARRARVRVTRRTIPVGQYCEAARRPPYFGTPQCSVRGWRSWFRGSLVRSCVVRTAANGARRSRLIRCWIACSGAATCAPRINPPSSRVDLTRTRMAIAREFVFRNKFKAVAGALRSARGTLLDVGARDRGLAQHLDTRHLSYFSADVGEGHDFQIDLERPLDFPDARFDHVVALDVLEHVEHIHAAFHELARIA